MADFRPFDYGQAVNAGSRNALLTMQTMAVGDQLREKNVLNKLKKQASETGEDYPSLVEKAGMPEKANQLRAMAVERGIKGMHYIAKRAPMVNSQESLDQFNNDMQRLQLAKPGEIPTEWNPQTQQFLSTISGNANGVLEKYGAFEQVPGMPGMYGQKSLKTGKYANVKSSKDLYGKDGSGGLKAADENAIYKQAGTLFGGRYDPISGTFAGLSRDKAMNAQAVAERGTQLFASGKAKTRTEAATRAARELGIEITDLRKPKNRQPDEKTKILLEQAKSAISAGADPEKVKQRLREMKVDPDLLQ